MQSSNPFAAGATADVADGYSPVQIEFSGNYGDPDEQLFSGIFPAAGGEPVGFDADAGRCWWAGLGSTALHRGGISRWRDCHFADALSPSLLKHLLKVEGGAAA